MRRLALALGLIAALACIPAVAHADPIEQDNQLMFGLVGTYVPAQNNLQGDVLGIGHYVSFSHALDFVYVGFRLALSGATGPQFLIDPDVFLGLRARIGKSFVLRAEVGTGPLVNGGDGFATSVIDHTYVRGAAQLRVVKSVVVEIFGGPGFVIGPFIAGVSAEWGLGVGWNP